MAKKNTEKCLNCSARLQYCVPPKFEVGKEPPNATVTPRNMLQEDTKCPVQTQ